MPPSKTVVQSDVLDWLAQATLTEEHAVVASIPDASELPNSAVEPWKEWFSLVAERVCRATHPRGLVTFFQSDVRHAGTWIDKGYLVQEAAKRAGMNLLLHRLVCRKPAGTISFHRATYSHLMTFSQDLRVSQHGYADVLPDGGPSVWTRGMGLHTCEAVVRSIRQETKATTLVHLFSGKGLLLELARREGLDVIGVDLSKKQCRHAQRFSLEKFLAAWADGTPNDSRLRTAR